MKVSLIPEKCIACGLCQTYSPIFDYDDEGISDDTRNVDEFDDYFDDDDFDSFDDYNIKKEKRKKGDTFEMDFIDLD